MEGHTLSKRPYRDPAMHWEHRRTGEATSPGQGKILSNQGVR